MLTGVWWFTVLLSVLVPSSEQLTAAVTATAVVIDTVQQQFALNVICLASALTKCSNKCPRYISQ